MLELPDPMTSTFIVGIACGICLAGIASRARRRRRIPMASPCPADQAVDTLSSEVDGELRVRSVAFANASGRPAAAPFVYSAIRDLALVRARHARAFDSEFDSEGEDER